MSNSEDNCGSDAGGKFASAEVRDIQETYKKINGSTANYGSFRHGAITEMVRPTDPSQALIQSSGNYVIHAVGILVIGLFWEKGGDLRCFKQMENGRDAAGKIIYNLKLADEPTLNQTPETNFLNIAVTNMFYAHIACFTLLLLTKLDILLVQSTARGLKSMFTFTSICIYLWYMFKAEFALRQYRPQYEKGSTRDSFMLLDATWPKKASRLSYAADKSVLGLACSQSHEGNSMVILWLELLFFLSNIFIILGSLIGAWFDETDVREPKTSDKILVKDFRKDNEKRRNPSLHIFSLQGYEQLDWGDRLDLGEYTKDTKAWKVADLLPEELIDNKNSIVAIEDEAAEAPMEGDEECEGGDDIQNAEEGEAEQEEPAENDDDFKKQEDDKKEEAPVIDKNKNSEEQKKARKAKLSQSAKDKIESMDNVIKGFENLRDNHSKDIELFRVKANDLDDQVRQSVNDTDTLKFLYDGDISFRRFQAYMFFVSAVVHVFSSITTADYMDVVIMRAIDEKANWKLEGGASKTYCSQQWGEDHYKGPIKILMASHLCLFIGLSISAKRQEHSIFWPVVFDYTKIRTKDLTDQFQRQFLCNFFALVAVLGATTAVAFFWEVSIKIDYENNPMCNIKSDRRRHSICSAWLLTDTIMSFMTLLMIYFEYKVGERDFTRKYRSRIMFAHSFSYEKFAMTDSYPDKASLVNIGLDQQLKDAVIKEHRLGYLKAQDAKNGTNEAESILSEEQAQKDMQNQDHIQAELDTLEEQMNTEEWNDDLKAKQEKYKFLKRKLEAEKRFPVTIDDFISQIRISQGMLKEDPPRDPRAKRYLFNASDVMAKDENGLTDAVKAEIDDNVSDLVKTLALGGSMYDFAFWTFFNEFNPLMLFEVKMKIFMTFGVHMLVVIYAFVDKQGSVDITSPFYGKIGIQLVRMVCAILLHLQMFPQTDKAIQMATFLIKNPGRFKSETVAFPAVIALVKLLTSLIVEFGSLALFMYINSEMTLIKFYTQLAIIAAIETNMAAIMTTRDLKGEIDTKPIQYAVKSSDGNSVISHAIKFMRDVDELNPQWVTIFDKLFLFILSLIIAPMAIFYILYYYLIMFVPLLQMMISANTRRYAPQDATKTEAFSIPFTPVSNKPAEPAAPKAE